MMTVEKPSPEDTLRFWMGDEPFEAQSSTIEPPLAAKVEALHHDATQHAVKRVSKSAKRARKESRA